VKKLDFAIAARKKEETLGGLGAARLQALDLFSNGECPARIQHIALCSWSQRVRWPMAWSDDGCQVDEKGEVVPRPDQIKEESGYMAAVGRDGVSIRRARIKPVLLLHRNENEEQRVLYAALIRLFKRHGGSLRGLEMKHLGFPAHLLLLCERVEFVELEGCKIYEDVEDLTTGKRFDDG